MDAAKDYDREVVRQWWQRFPSTPVAVAGTDDGQRRLTVAASKQCLEGGLMAAAAFNGGDDG